MQRGVRRPLVALVVLVLALVIGYVVKAADSNHDGSRSSAPSTSRSAPAPSAAAVALSSLPMQARRTVELIKAGGPFPYPAHDGLVFHNSGYRLPRERDGYYHEYTVPTPGTNTRGADRMITGADGEFYYTADHYNTFRRVDVSR